MSVETEPSPTGRKRDYALKRHIGLIGLTWASMGSIIGSGWLFAPRRRSRSPVPPCSSPG